MEVNLYIIYDKVAQEAGPIFEAKNDAIAVRNVQGLFLRKAESILSNPQDYMLYKIGAFNRDTMELSVIEKIDIAINLGVQ